MKNVLYRTWLDSLVALVNMSKTLIKFSNDVFIVNNIDYIQMHGLEIVADELGLVIEHEYTELEKYPHELSFMYKGVKFLQILTEEEYIGE